MPPGSLGRLLQHHPNEPTTNPALPLVTQVPPMPPPPPRQNFQSVDLHTHLPLTSEPLLISNSKPPITYSQTSVVTSEGLGTSVQYLLTASKSQWTLTSSRTPFQHQVSDELLIEPDSQGSNISAVSLASEITESFTETSMPPLPSKLPVGTSFGFLEDSYLQTPTLSPVTQTKRTHSGPVTQSSASQAELHQTQPHQLLTESQLYLFYRKTTSRQVSQTNLEDPGHQKTHPSPKLSQISQAYPQQSFTQSLSLKFHLELSTIQHYLPSTQPSPPSVTNTQQSQMFLWQTLPKPTSTISTPPQSQPQSSPTQHPLLHSPAPPPQTETFPFQHRNPLKTQPSVSTIHPPDQTYDPSTLNPETPVVHQVNMSNQVQLNTSQQGDPVQSAKSANDSELTEWLKRNTSQSPMTSNDPR